jgi:hypothetical protein
LQFGLLFFLTHGIRKYFKTQLIALGVQEDYADYFMGHTVDTYHDIQSLGIDKLRSICAAAGLALRKKTALSKIDTIKEIIRELAKTQSSYYKPGILNHST